VLVSTSAKWGFAYYWRDGRVVFDHRPAAAPVFRARALVDDPIVWAEARSYEAVSTGLNDAVDLA
jgi:hypothetical protein